MGKVDPIYRNSENPERYLQVLAIHLDGFSMASIAMRLRWRARSWTTPEQAMAAFGPIRLRLGIRNGQGEAQLFLADTRRGAQPACEALRVQKEEGGELKQLFTSGCMKLAT